MTVRERLALEQRAERQAEVFEKAREERSVVSVEDQLEPPDLAEELLVQVGQKMACYDEVRRDTSPDSIRRQPTLLSDDLADILHADQQKRAPEEVA